LDIADLDVFEKVTT